jgi:hypothetical protein
MKNITLGNSTTICDQYLNVIYKTTYRYRFHCVLNILKYYIFTKLEDVHFTVKVYSNSNYHVGAIDKAPNSTDYNDILFPSTSLSTTDHSIYAYISNSHYFTIYTSTILVSYSQNHFNHPSICFTNTQSFYYYYSIFFFFFFFVISLFKINCLSFSTSNFSYGPNDYNNPGHKQQYNIKVK